MAYVGSRPRSPVAVGLEVGPGSILQPRFSFVFPFLSFVLWECFFLLLDDQGETDLLFTETCFDCRNTQLYGVVPLDPDHHLWGGDKLIERRKKAFLHVHQQDWAEAIRKPAQTLSPKSPNLISKASLLRSVGTE